MRCQVCNSGLDISVHHRTYDTHGREHSNMMDLVVLCSNCHGLFHGHITREYVLPTPMRAKRERKPAAKAASVKPGVMLPHTEADLQMPDGEAITLTKELIKRCRTSQSGFTNATIRAFGIKKEDLTQGWPFRLRGKVLSREDYRKALEGRFHYNTRLE